MTPDDKLGPYEITGLLGKGGMGEVYRATDTRLHRDVAIKVSAEKFTDRFVREARAVAALNHPHIGQLYDVGPNYLVMEPVATIAMPFGNRGLSWVSKSKNTGANARCPNPTIAACVTSIVATTTTLC